jgi:deoxyribonuclease IV
VAAKKRTRAKEAPTARKRTTHEEASLKPAVKKRVRDRLLGAHMSIAGGYYKAVLAARDAGCGTVQLFTKNTSQWKAKEITQDDSDRFAEALKDTGVSTPTAHASYLINLASPDPVLWKKSLESFVDEIRRCAALSVEYLVLHPGAHKEGTEEDGLRLVSEAINEALDQTSNTSVSVLVETTAGQGTCLGHRFEHLADILENVESSERIGVCFDTCHVFAAGYAMDTQTAYRRTMREFNGLIGLKRLKAFHLNDSKREFGSRVDRHDHIGLGHIGLAPFRFLMNDRRFRKTPMYLETPKGTEEGEDLDMRNLRTLRELIGSK